MYWWLEHWNWINSINQTPAVSLFLSRRVILSVLCVRDTRGPPTNKLSVYDCIQSCWKYYINYNTRAQKGKEINQKKKKNKSHKRWGTSQERKREREREKSFQIICQAVFWIYMFDWRRNRENRSDGTRALKSPL